MRHLVSLTAAIAVTGALLFTPVAGCNALSKGETAGKNTIVSCAKQDVTQAVGSGATTDQLIAKVIPILIAGESDWQAQLIALGTVVGLDALNCSVRAAVAAIAAMHGSIASTSEALHAEPETSAALARGQAFLSGVTFE